MEKPKSTSNDVFNDTSKNNKKPNSSVNGYLATSLLIFAIFLVWLIFPSLLNRINSPPVNQTEIVIPYQIDAMLNIENVASKSLEEEKTYFQNIGDQLGAYGDSYGSLNTLFSGLAFALLIISLHLQLKELEAQRGEISDQKDEIRRGNVIADGQKTITDQQRLLIEQQLHDSKVQNFYALLFKFLEEKRRKVDEMNGRPTNGTFHKGITHFEIFIHFVEDYFGDFIRNINVNDPELDFQALKTIIYDAIRVANNQTDNVILDEEYMEYLCFIIRFIESHKDLGITDDAIKIFVSYQSFNEAYAMFLFAIYLDDLELQNFISKYALLRKLKTYHNANKNFSNLVDCWFGEIAYSP